MVREEEGVNPGGGGKSKFEFKTSSKGREEEPKGEKARVIAEEEKM